uniref:Ribosomal RNA methyltransferase FtsJ domain-containing protein n=1 Tax=viral metagenome TaxID=1070528 RepID=A0A6C0LGQ2_9ZZZZ
MSYYLLPTKNTMIDILPKISTDISLVPRISQSLDYYIQTMNEELHTNIESNHTLEYLQKNINPHEYLFTNVSGAKFSVSKMKPYSSEFYVFLEIIYTLDIFDFFINKNITTFICSQHSKSIIECIDIVRENYNDEHCKECLERYIDFMYFELDYLGSLETYIYSFLSCLAHVLEFQNHDGITVIKIDTIVHKPILDILFLFTSLYEKVYIIKPNASNLCNNEKYIVAKHFLGSIKHIESYLPEITKILLHTKLKSKLPLFSSIVKDDLPYYFLNKVEEVNIIIGHQYLEHIEQMIHLVKNKTKEDKIEHRKKTNIQKCIQWCEKYKIPYNRFIEKVNIFLNTQQEQEQEDEKDLIVEE